MSIRDALIPERPSPVAIHRTEWNPLGNLIGMHFVKRADNAWVARNTLEQVVHVQITGRFQ